jgi:pseudouridine-5'-phosphate glycosidase
VGQDAFPAFWSRDSGLKAPLRLDTAEGIAAAHRMRAGLGLPGGQLVANPIPVEAEIPSEMLSPLIIEATAAAAAQHVTGKDVTPFLLQWLFERTQGRTLQANIALVLNNARLAAQIARALVT